MLLFVEERVVEGDANWEEIFGDCRAAVDFPAGRYYRELIEESPAVIDLQPVPGPAFRLGASLRDNEGNPPLRSTQNQPEPQFVFGRAFLLTAA